MTSGASSKGSQAAGFTQNRAKARRFFGGLAVLAALAGCAPVPKPSVLADVDKVRQGAAAAEAKENAPGSFESAEKLRREAEAAYDAGDIAGAQILGERALAAYAHAHALARIARAEAEAAKATSALTTSKAELTSIEADQTRVAAELSAAELRIKVATDAQPVVPSGPADAEREKARLAAARALALQAKLLCGAARLLLASSSSSAEPLGAPPPPPGSVAAPAPSSASTSSSAASAPAPSASVAAPAPAAASASPSASAAASPSAAPSASASAGQPTKAPLSNPSLTVRLDEALDGVAKLESTLQTAAAAPIDQASRARAACLSVLTSVRRASTPVSRAPGAGDALLTELSAAGSWSPSRDERGITVTLRGLFKGDALTPAGAARLAELGRISAAHPAFPLVVVIHHDKEVTKRDEAALAARADRVVRALKDAKAPRVEPIQAGAAAPVVDPSGAQRARNARVEVVFVTPETF